MSNFGGRCCERVFNFTPCDFNLVPEAGLEPLGSANTQLAKYNEKLFYGITYITYEW